MDAIFKLNSAVNSIVWGPYMLCLLVGTGIYLSLILGFPQLRYFIIFNREVLTKKKKAAVVTNDKSISSFAALATAMAATLGTGNIAGVATALHLGGPGAFFWMLFSAFFGMATKFGEIILAVKYRQKDEHGDWRGGTMHIMEHGANKKWLAITFAFFAFLASFGIGAAVQANSTAEGLNMGFGLDPMISGVLLVIFVAMVIIGGLKTLSTVSTYVIPFMAVFYVIGGLIVIILNAHQIPYGLTVVFKYAFEDPMAMPGALAGWTVKQAITRGIARGVFSNEAGLGSAPMVHCTANIDHPVRQGLYGLFEVFFDTIVNVITTLSIICTGALTGIGLSGSAAAGWSPDLSGARLALFAFETGMGPIGTYVLSIGLVLFAYTTILGWYWYGESAGIYIFGIGFKPVFKVLYLGAVFIGAAGSVVFGTSGKAFLDNVWDMADTFNGLMAIPNLIGLLLLSGVIRALVKEFDEKRKSGELQV
jgi:AGCS family alanine or glycine:cation symporter